MTDNQKSVAGEDQKPNISAYLQAPRKKRKNYVLIAARQGLERSTVQYIEGYVKKYHSNLAVAKPVTIQDLRRQLNRNVSLLILDDEFAPLVPMLHMLRKIREKRRKETIPILFLTRNPPDLIAAYHQTLAGFQEIDEFVEYSNIERSQILGRVKIGIEQKNRRRSRRFNVEIGMTYFLLRKDSQLQGRIIDLSMHGALIESVNDEVFQIGDQLKLMVPVERFIGIDGGEFLRISAKVRRVFINGITAGVSFEYVSENQNVKLTKIIASIISDAIVGAGRD